MIFDDVRRFNILLYELINNKDDDHEDKEDDKGDAGTDDNVDNISNISMKVGWCLHNTT